MNITERLNEIENSCLFDKRMINIVKEVVTMLSFFNLKVKIGVYYSIGTIDLAVFADTVTYGVFNLRNNGYSFSVIKYPLYNYIENGKLEDLTIDRIHKFVNILMQRRNNEN